MMDGLQKLTEMIDLSPNEAEDAMKAMMSGTAAEVDVAAFLVALKMKGESPGEIAAMAKVMREYAVKIRPKVSGILVDMCGTGGDGSGTFNISTAASFVVAAGGVPVAKHGNRSFTSKCGSADVLEALGARIDLRPERIESCIEEVGIGFMFAPAHHPAMKHVMPVRKQLGIRTVFNILGPLTNPAGAKAQIMGVYDPSLTERLAEVFRLLGLRRAFVVNGHPGLDEFSTIGPTKVSELNGGTVRNYVFGSATLGFDKARLEDLKGGDAGDNAKIIRGVFSGEIKGAKRDIVVLNAAAGLAVGGVVDDLQSACEIAGKVIDSGGASDKLDEFIAYTRG
ncbi:MAG: anthranilate phosphoribosyltransferase [Candidatus Altiarchaeota archaeon]